MWGALSGMEVPLYVFLFLASFKICLLAPRLAPRKHIAAAALLALTGTARPECWSLILLFMCIPYINRRQDSASETGIKRLLPQTLGQFAAFAAVFSLSLVFHHYTSGHLLPTTFAAKSSNMGIMNALKPDVTVMGIAKQACVYCVMVWSVFLVDYWPFFVLAAIASRYWWKSCRKSGDFRFWAVPGVLVLYTVAKALVAPVGDYVSQWSRYLTLFFPILIIFSMAALKKERTSVSSVTKKRLLWLAIGLCILSGLVIVFESQVMNLGEWLYNVRRSTVNFSTRRVKALLLLQELIYPVFALAAGLLLSLIIPPGKKTLSYRRVAVMSLVAFSVAKLIVSSQGYALGIKNINDIHVTTGKWIANNIPDQAVIGLHDIGAIKYFSNRKVVDLQGLTHPEIIPFRTRGLAGLEEFLKENPYITYLSVFADTAHPSGLDLEEVFRVRGEDNISSVRDTLLLLKIKGEIP